MTSINNNQIVDDVASLKKELSQLNSLFEFTSITNSVTDLEALSMQLACFLNNTFELKNIAFFLLQGESYRIICHENLKYPYSYEIVRQDDGIWKLFEEGKPINLLNDKGEKLYSNFQETANLIDLDLSIALPLVHNNNIIGIIFLGEKVNKSQFSAEDLNLLTFFIKYFSPVVNKFKEQKEKEAGLINLQKTLHNISILYNIGQAMNFIDDLKRLIQVILAKALQTLGAERGSLMLYDASQDALVVKVVYGLPDKDAEKKINEGLVECTKIKPGEGIAGEAFVTKKAIITNLGENDPRFKKSQASRVQSLICIPLVVKDESLGVINISNKQDGKFFNQDDLDFMGALANQAAIAINNAQLYELAITDSLTKLFIRRHFDHLIESEIKRSGRYNHPVSLLMMDIDNFKSINDTYGHQVGDDILKHISAVIKNTVRKIDSPCRYGGEEFAVILPETKKENSKVIAERLRKKIQSIKIEIEGKEIKPTISIGIANFPVDAKTKEELIGCADKALYFAKDKGKNCVIEYNKDGCKPIENGNC